MKKLLLIAMLFIAGVTQLKANDTIVDVTQCYNGQVFYICLNRYDRLALTTPNGCSGFTFVVNDENTYHESPIIIDGNQNNFYWVDFLGCGISPWIEFYVNFIEPEIPNSTTTELWKHQNCSLPLEPLGADSLEMYSISWSTGATTPIIDVTESGTYICYISDDCATATRTFIVKDNVEIMSASVDPFTNKNLVTWETIPEQSEYISNVIINRDGVDMATVPYTDGQYLDNIGSDLAARVYTITGVCPDGTLCPIPSYQRGTIHMAFLPDINGNVEMTWNQPILDGAPIHVNRFEICEYDPDSNEISVIDFVSSVTTSYSCNQSMFDYGYPLIRAVIHDGRGDKDMLSNRTDELVGLNEMATDRLHVYPNPSSGVFTINGSGILHIINVVGQEIMAKEIDGKETVTLPKGVYFVQLNGTVQKIVVE